MDRPDRQHRAGYVQANVVILPESLAREFLVYCQRNPAARPLLDVTDVGDPEPRFAAPDADLRTDLARYAVYRDGVRGEDLLDISALWNDRSVGFLLGSSLAA